MRTQTPQQPNVLSIPGFDKELHRQLKITAAERGITLKAAADLAVRAYVFAPQQIERLANRSLQPEVKP